MSILYNGDCLEEMKQIDDNSIDLIFVDLPYGQTSCKWDVKIDLTKMWEQYMRIKKLNTPIFFTTTTKFGVDIINSAPKKCPFRYDIVWCKSAPAGFLSAKKMPMRKHEMVYVFYEKLPFYDLSSHKHKFIDQSKNKNKLNDGIIYNGGKEMKVISDGKGKQYSPPLPVSVVKEPEPELESKYVGKPPQEKIIKDTKMGTNTYGTEKRNKPIMRQSSEAQYSPPLPVSVVKESNTHNTQTIYGNFNIPNYDEDGINRSTYDPPLPVSIVKEPEPEAESKYVGKPVMRENTTYGDVISYEIKERKNGESRYDPPLPVSVVKEDVYKATERFKNGKLTKHPRHLQKGDDPIYDPPLPVSVVKEEMRPTEKYKNESTMYGNIDRPDFKRKDGESMYQPPLPTTMLEIKSTRGKHSTEKPVALMEWVLKYYSKEGDVVLDNCMGSGSTGVACQNMNRNFIGIEKDPEIYEVAFNRINPE